MSNVKKSIKILVIIAIIAAICFGITFGLLALLQNEKSMYSNFAITIEDSHTKDYLEKDENLNPISAAYPGTLEEYRIVSNSLQERLDYHLPYLVHLKFNASYQKEAKKLLDNFNNVKIRFSELLNETKTDSLKGQNKNPDLYFGAFLPKYQDYIEQKYNMLDFIENFFENKNFVLNSYLNNLSRLQNMFFEFSINIALPSISSTRSTDFGFGLMLTDLSNVSLNFLSSKFLDFKYNFATQTDSVKIKLYEEKINELEMGFDIIMNTFYNLTSRDKQIYFNLIKTKPSVISPILSTYARDFVQSYFATDNGKFMLDYKSSDITNFFKTGVK